MLQYMELTCAKYKQYKKNVKGKKRDKSTNLGIAPSVQESIIKGNSPKSSSESGDKRRDFVGDDGHDDDSSSLP